MVVAALVGNSYSRAGSVGCYLPTYLPRASVYLRRSNPTTYYLHDRPGLKPQRLGTEISNR